jgi:oxygen-independent coproporphyrinogen-3 oxidase
MTQANYPSSELVIDPVLIRKYDVSGPRYTSYPTADRFVEAFGEASYRQALGGRGVGGFAQPLSLYVHVPFCTDVCFYCGCNKKVTRDRSQGLRYLDYLACEMRLVGAALHGEKRLAQMHWGGGTPTFLGQDNMARLVDLVDRHFQRGPDCECSIEVDPRDAAPGTMAFLASLGFNRVSLGVQDFDPAVQQAIHRVQPAELTERAMREAKQAGFRSINVDLIYGLPRQTLDSFSATLDRIIDLDPDRIALYGYAHLPQKFKPQRRIDEAELPSAETRLQILTLAIGRLTRAGYLYIGMDHFAKPADDLAVAQRQGRLHRNFQGYSTLPDCDMIGLGASSIGRIGAAYSQNHRELRDYEAALDAQRLPVARGLALTRDDLVRHAVIQALICQFRLSVQSIENSYLIEFGDYFARELEELRALEEEGLLVLGADGIEVTARGRPLVRVICMAFDRYLREGRRAAGYSRVL